LRVDTPGSAAITVDHSWRPLSIPRLGPIYPTRKNHSAGQFACRRTPTTTTADLAGSSPAPGIPVFSSPRKRRRRSKTSRRAWAARSLESRPARGVIKIRLIYAGRNTNVEHCSDYQWLNCRPFGPRESHYAARRNKSGPANAARLLPRVSLFALPSPLPLDRCGRMMSLSLSPKRLGVFIGE